VNENRPLSVPMIPGTPRVGRLGERVANLLLEEAGKRQGVQMHRRVPDRAHFDSAGPRTRSGAPPAGVRCGAEERNRMPERERVRCPRCGAEMNRRGEMVDCAAGLAEPWAADPDLGGALQEVHQCPNCGCFVTCRVT
jgi:ssDNA-binding Zn-finger/Zn-ribbon topoisomerase 1